MNKKNYRQSAPSLRQKSHEIQRALLIKAGIPKFVVRMMEMRRVNFAVSQTMVRPRHD